MENKKMSLRRAAQIVEAAEGAFGSGTLVAAAEAVLAEHGIACSYSLCGSGKLFKNGRAIHGWDLEDDE